MDGPGLSRRRLLERLTWALLLFWSGALATVAALPFFSPVLRRQKEAAKRLLLGPPALADGPDPQAADVVVLRRSGWYRERRVVRVFVLPERGGEIAALSARCTHLGCRVAWNGVERRFECPCHGGRFDPEGNVIGGPPPSPLLRLPVVKENEVLWIEWS